MTAGYPGRTLPLLVITLLTWSGGLPAVRGGEHPHLLIASGDVPRIKHVCGVGTPADAARNWGKFGRASADFNALRAHFARPLEGEVLPGELLALAFLHVVDPSDPADATRVRIIQAALRRTEALATAPLELVLALDWCWPALDADARRDFLLLMREQAEPLAAADSPLEPRVFRARLAALALALSIDEADDPSPSWTGLRSRLLEAGRKYFESTFPTYVAWRGLSPTGPAVAAREECDTALAVELAGGVLEHAVWPEYCGTVGRWLEHYVFGTFEHPALQHNFIRDDGNQAPRTPAPTWRDLLPLTAHLIAARTRDPAAGLIAGRVESVMRASSDELAVLWRWVPIVMESAALPRCDPRRLPAARNLGGSVVFRGGHGPEATAVWIDAAQPFLRRRQHFDAGHFLIYRGGHLAVGGGDDVSFEAVPSKEGWQRLGGQRDPFDFEQYFTATIAHNGLLVWDAAWVSRWYGARYLSTGGQRCSEGTCTDFVAPLAVQNRATGRQLAYGQQQTAAYVALELTPAYDPRALSAYTREFVFFWGHALVVIDRVTLANVRSVPTWVLNLPARPKVDGQELPDKARVAGSTNQAGVWRCDTAKTLHWDDRDGRLRLSAPLPAPKCLRVVGGPAQRVTVEKGPYAGRTYVGGDADSFERLILPAERHGALNAWYRLGEPTLLGPEFGVTPHWGRIEIEPARRDRVCVFVTVLVTDHAAAEQPPNVALETTADGLLLTVQLGEERATLRVPAGMERGGTLEAAGTPPLSWTLPGEVQPDEPLRAD